MRFIEYTAAGGVVLDGAERVLLIERWVERNGEEQHEIRLPKGHVDEGESDEQAAVRETCEESGYCALEVIADLGTAVTDFVRPARNESKSEYIRRTEHYYLLRLTEERRGEPNFQSAEEAGFRPLWATNLEEAEQMLTFDGERRFITRARAFMAAPHAWQAEAG